MGELLPVRPFEQPGSAHTEPLWRELTGELLRERRHERGEKLTETAGRAGISTQYLSEIERGRKDPSSEVLSAVAGALDLTLLDLTRRAARRLTLVPGNPVSTRRHTVPLALAA